MGGLGEQPPREHYRVLETTLRDYLDLAARVAKAHNAKIADVLYADRTLEYSRRTAVMIQDGDYRDEQAGGFGRTLSFIGDSLSLHADGMTEIRGALDTLSGVLEKLGCADEVGGIARALERLGCNGATTDRGVIESHTEEMTHAAADIASSICDLASAVREAGGVVE